MSPRDLALFHYYQSRRASQRPVTETDLAEFERQYEAEMEAVRREMAPVQACIERR